MIDSTPSFQILSARIWKMNEKMEMTSGHRSHSTTPTLSGVPILLSSLLYRY